MAKSITTSIVVQFTQGEGGDGSLQVEIDDRETVDGGLNGGKTSFLPGDTVVLLQYKTTNVVMDAELTSLGTLTPLSTITIQKTEDITFAGEIEASTKYPVSGSLTSAVWIGANLGTLAVSGETTLRIPPPPVGEFAVGLVRITYNTVAKVYQLTHSDPGFSEYGIVVFFAGHT